MENVSREQKLENLSQYILTKSDRWNINTQLYGVKGLDYISSVLKQFGLDIGTQTRRNEFSLVRDGTVIMNAWIKGDYNGMQIFPVLRLRENEKL